jgi:AraC-like DNA-binding protein
MNFNVIPIPKALQDYVECIRTSEYDGDESFAVNVCVNGLPGIVFQHHNGRSPIENITTPSSVATCTSTLFVYGQMMQPGVMHHKKVSFTMTQIVLKPHALQTLLGINASVLTNSLVELAEFSAGDLNMQLLEAHNEQEQLTLLTNFLVAKHKQAPTRDRLVEESLRLIHNNIGSISVKYLLEHLNISERQFEKRFSQVIGLPPQFYIRVKRFNEAIRLMQTRPFEKLTDVAHNLNFYDQSHFIRDIKAFSGITPKNLFQKLDFQPDQKVVAYYERDGFLQF